MNVTVQPYVVPEDFHLIRIYLEENTFSGNLFESEHAVYSPGQTVPETEQDVKEYLLAPGGKPIDAPSERGMGRYQYSNVSGKLHKRTHPSNRFLTNRSWALLICLSLLAGAVLTFISSPWTKGGEISLLDGFVTGAAFLVFSGLASLIGFIVISLVSLWDLEYGES